MVTIKEGSDGRLVIRFFNPDGELEAPQAATWLVRDVRSEQELVGPMAISPISAEVQVELPAAANVILDQGQPQEKRRVLVQATFAGDKTLNETYDYLVKNLSWVGS